MKEWRGLFLPDGETHLIDWMQARNEIVNGKPTYQHHKLRAAVDLCPPDRRRLAVDVGAHCGLWSMHLMNEFGLVAAFEPVAAHRECFRMNCASGIAAERISLRSEALSDRSGDEVVLITEPTSSGDTRIDTSGARAGHVAMTVRLDDCLLGFVDFIKIDCEGFELPVLRGSEDLIERCRPVICVEQKPGHAQRFGFGETEAVTWLLERGYRQARVMSGDYLMVPL